MLNIFLLKEKVTFIAALDVHVFFILTFAFNCSCMLCFIFLQQSDRLCLMNVTMPIKNLCYTYYDIFWPMPYSICCFQRSVNVLCLNTWLVIETCCVKPSLLISIILMVRGESSVISYSYKWWMVTNKGCSRGNGNFAKGS